MVTANKVLCQSQIVIQLRGALIDRNRLVQLLDSQMKPFGDDGPAVAYCGRFRFRD